MIVNSITSFTCPLNGSGEMADITIVIITPHQCHIFGHLQSRMINIEYLFIRNKDLWHLSNLFIYILFKQPALICRYTVQDRFLLFYRFGTLHLSIVHATHT